MKRNILKTTVASIIVTISLLTSVTQSYAAVYYQKSEVQNLAKNITYESVKMVTDKGLLDVYVLTVPTKDPYIKIKTTSSLTAFELKEETNVLLKNAGAIAGINGDFFDLAGDYSGTVGPSVTNGQLTAADVFTNTGSKKYGTFFLDNSGNPFIDYMKVEMKLLLDGTEKIKVSSVNKVSTGKDAIYIDRNAMQDTQSIDKRIPNATKVVVSNGVVTDIKKGETVAVPENGFIVLYRGDADISTLAKVGQKAEFSVKTSIDYDAMQTAISGGGILLKDGQIVIDNGNVPANAQPRTVVGYTKNNDKLIMMVVDGRSHSVGATHAEVGQLMLKYGAYNAIHLDGGGSSTMALKKPFEGGMSVVNTPSGGISRRVANALGVYVNTPSTLPVSQLTVKPQTDRVFKNTGVPVAIIASDEYFTNQFTPTEQLAVNFTDANGVYEGGYFYPSKASEITFGANYKGLTSKAVITAMELAQLKPRISKISTTVGGSTFLEFNGVSEDGISSYIYKGVKYEVVPNTIGHMDGDTFVADNFGAGYIKCSVGDVTSYIDVNVGIKEVPFYSFDEGKELWFISYPTTIKGDVLYNKEQVKEGTASAVLKYAFEPSEATQAAYFTFAEPLSLSGDPTSLKLWVYGDNSGNWLRAKLLDAENKPLLVDFARKVDWTGWKQVEAKITPGAMYPLRLERIYIASTSNTDISQHTLYFDGLTGTVATQHAAVEHASGTVFVDKKRTDLKQTMPAQTEFDITIAGDIAIYGDKKPADYAQVQAEAISKLTKNAAMTVLAGEYDAQTAPKGSINWSNGYSATTNNNVSVISIKAANGGLAATDVAQWAKLSNDLKNIGSENVIIITDINPMNYNVSKEFELLHDMLLSAKKKMFVVSTQGYSNATVVKDGIRYVNLGGLFYDDGSVNEAYSSLRLRVSNGAVLYDFE